MAQKFTTFTPLEEAAPTFTTFTPIEEGAEGGERTWGEAATDIGAGAVSGLGKLAQFPGQLYGLTTGAIKDKDFATTGMQGVGKEMQDWAKAQKSAELKRRETETQKKVQEAEKTGGQWEAFKTQLYESGTDPMQLGAFLAETAPASIPSIIAAFIPGAGPALAAEVKMLQIAAQAAATAATKQAAQQALGVAMKEAAKSAVKRGTTAAVSVGAVQQGTDVGAGTYKKVYDALIAKGVSPEQAAEQTINKARAAGAAGAVISLLTQLLPGGRAMERALAGEKGKLGRVAGAVVGGVKGTPGEIIEEVGGKGLQNVAARTVDPEQSLTEGLGATAAQAGIGGFGMGSTVGALQGRQTLEAPTPTIPGTTPGINAATPTAKQQARQDAVAQRAQQLEEQSGITAEDAVRIAEDDIAAEEAKIAGLSAFNAPKVGQALSGAETERDTRVKTRAVELIDKQGMDPQIAYATALQQVQDEIESDVLAGEEGALNVTGPKPTTSRKRTAVVSKPTTGTTAAGPAAPTGVGVVPPAGNAGVPNVGETAQPAAVAKAPAQFTTFTPVVVTEPAARPEITAQRATLEKLLPKEAGNLKLEKIEARSGNWRVVYTTTNAAGMTMQGSMPVEAEELMGKTDAEIKTILADRAQKNGLKGVSDTIKDGGDKPKPAVAPKVAKVSKAAKEMPPQLVDLAVAQAATDPAEIQKHLADIETEGATLLSKNGGFPKKGTTKRVRLDEIGVLKRDLTAKLQPAVAPVVETPVAKTQPPAPAEKKQPVVYEKGAYIPPDEKGGDPVATAGFKVLDEDNDISENLAGATLITGMNTASRNAGDGSRLLKSITDWADSNGTTLALVPAASPDAELGGLSQEQLKDWYARNGFEDRADYMVREPAGKKAEVPVAEAPTEAPVAEAKTEKSDDWASFIDEIEQEVNQEIAETDAIIGEPPFDQTQRQPWKVEAVGGIGAELTAELAEERQKRRGFAQTEAAAKAKEKQERATKAETAEGAETKPDEAAKARAGAVDVVERSLEIVGALQEVAGSTDFPEGTRTNARKYLAEIARANNENEAPEGSLEPAFLFLVDLASKPRFMRTGINKSLPSIGKAKVQAVVDLVASRWGNAPTVVVADNINDAVVPAELQKADAEAKAKGATGVPAGVFYQGKVYIFADQMKSTAETVRTLLHESLGHYGLRGVFGEGLKPILQLVAKNFKGEMDALAKKYGLDFSKEADVMEAAEEILANIAQTKPTMGVMQRAIAAVRRFLRKIGFDVKLSNKDLIANYILPARAFVENRRIDRAVAGAPGFSRKATDKFLAWFGNSKVVDEKGEPLVVYHGMPNEMEGGVFRQSKYGSLGEGIYFTDNPDVASRFATGVRGSTAEAKLQGSVVPAYLRMQQPFDDTFFVGNKGWQEWAASIVRRGQDPDYEYWATYARWMVGSAKEEVKILNKLHGKLMAGKATLNDLLFAFKDSETPWGKQILEAVKKQGAFDGVILKGGNKGFNEYVVFNPNQVKSATGNNGEYSLSNDDIRFSRTTEEADLTPEQSKVLEDTVRTQEEIDKAVAKAKFKFEESAKAQKAAKGVSVLQMATDPRKVIPAMRDLWKRATSAQRNLLVKIPPTSFLVDWAGNAVPELQNTYKLMQQMGGMTEQLLNAAGELTNEVQRAFQADPTLRGKLDELTSVATLAKVDPGMVDTIDRSDVLDKAWKDLGPEGQRVYKRIRDHFNVLSKYLSKLLDDQVNSLGVNAEAKANIMKKIRATFEKGSRINPYFPLVREGDFWLSMGSGETRTFFMAETAAERDRAAREFAAEKIKRGANESEAAFEKRIDEKLDELEKDSEFEMGDDITSLRSKSYFQGQSSMLTGVFDAIDSTDFADPEAGGLLKDAVYQTFLETMPDQVFRKQFIQRKGIAGFRVDVLQNTAHLSARMATQLARIKYSPLLRNSLSAAKDSIRGRRAFEPYVAEMASRVDSSLAPKAKSTAEAVAGGLNKAAFIYYLSGASSALLQPLSVFQLGLPVLARYGAFNAVKEVSSMLKIWSQVGVYKTNADGSESWVAPSILYSKDLTPLERKAYRAAAERGLFTSTQTSSVFEYKATPTDKLRGPKEKFARGTVDALVLGGLMNSSERISREMLWKASFRLNMKEHGNYERAVNQSVTDTNEALFDYGESNRPAFMRGAVGKVVTQFMMFPLNVTMFLVKNFKEMIKPMDGRSRAEASYKFFGTMGTTYILAGSVGLPMFSTVMGLLGAAWEELKDDDWDEDMRALGFEAWFTTKWLHDQLGENKIGGVSLSDLLLRGPVNAFTGVDIAGRTGIDLKNLWTRDTKEQKTVRESATAFALEKAGPAANMILSVADGVDAAMQGDYAKAVKKWAPAGFRNFFNAHELATEGAKDNKGAQIMTKDAFSLGALIAQAIGFRSDLLANTQYTAFKVIGAQQKIFNEQTRLLDNLDREFRNNNAAGYSKQFNKIVDFNRRYPSFAMDLDQIGDSLEKRMERRGTAYMGVVPTEKNLILLDALRHSGRRVAEAERKGREQ